jgi:hypothetical protein
VAVGVAVGVAVTAGVAVGVAVGPAWATADQTVTASATITRDPTTEWRIIAFDAVALQRTRLAIIKDMRGSSALQPTWTWWQRLPPTRRADVGS